MRGEFPYRKCDERSGQLSNLGMGRWIRESKHLEIEDRANEKQISYQRNQQAKLGT
jgi:hypothetical protein